MFSFLACLTAILTVLYNAMQTPPQMRKAIKKKCVYKMIFAAFFEASSLMASSFMSLHPLKIFRVFMLLSDSPPKIHASKASRTGAADKSWRSKYPMVQPIILKESAVVLSGVVTASIQ